MRPGAQGRGGARDHGLRYGGRRFDRANKFRGISAALCHDVYSAHQSVEHDDVNALCIGAQIVGDELAFDLLRAFLEAEHSPDEEYRRRVAKLMELGDR